MSPPGAVAALARPGVTTSPDMAALRAAAETILGNVGINFGPNKVNRLCVTFAERVERNGFAFFDFLANTVQLDADQRRRVRMDPEMASVIEYADRTGESAVNNVIRERGY